MPNWLLNMEVVCYRRAHMAKMFPTFYGIPTIHGGQKCLQRVTEVSAHHLAGGDK